jgi:broad specificity phosphatase PhoE
MGTEVAGASAGLAEQVARLDHCLLLVRHGRTVWNDEDRVSTRTDIELTRAGLADAERVRRALAGAHFDSAFSSPLQRARRTAEIALADAEAPDPVADERLVEPDAGLFEGQVFADLEQGELAAVFAASQAEVDPVFPDGVESIGASAARARGFLDEIEARPGRHFAASHGGLIRILASEFLGLPPSYYRRLKLSNCHAALLKFYPEPPHQLAGWNLAPI